MGVGTFVQFSPGAAPFCWLGGGGDSPRAWRCLAPPGLVQDFILLSPLFGASAETRHLHFSYHMRGAGMGTLRLESWGNSSWTELFTRSGDRGSHWYLAFVALPPEAEALRFVGTTGNSWASDMALDAIAAGLPRVEVDFHQLSCNFGSDTCLWYSPNASSSSDSGWQRVAGDSDQEHRWWLQASESGAGPSDFVFESSPFNIAEEKALLFSYQLVGSAVLSVEIEADDWQAVFVLEPANNTLTWQQASVMVPQNTGAMRLRAQVTNGDLVKVASVVAATPVPNLADISCGFEGSNCGWWSNAGSWQSRSGPAPNQLYTGPSAAFRDEFYVHVEAYDVMAQALVETFRIVGDRRILAVWGACKVGRVPVLSRSSRTPAEDAVSLVSPRFPELPSDCYLEFAYHMRGSGMGDFELQYFRRGRWWTRWSRRGSQGPDWLQAKVSLPAGTSMLRFVSSNSQAGEDFYGTLAVDAIAAWQPEAQPQPFLTLCSGEQHGCALLLAEGQVKCWGRADAEGQVAYGSTVDVGTLPKQMGEWLPLVPLGQGARALQLACGHVRSCALLDGGLLKCWGDNDAGELGQGHTDDIGNDPNEMGDQLPPVDLGSGVVQVGIGGDQHTCVVLTGGRVKCFGRGTYLGLGDGSGPESQYISLYLVVCLCARRWGREGR